uniref:Ig-like domain-containing protein n=1 Tax=Cyclopterus lumpus TaxID=8103 RepID=A0A8C2ZD44_CYCLU
NVIDSRHYFGVATNPAVPITQIPRFYGARTRHNAGICCRSARKLLPAKVEWFKASRYTEDDPSRSEIKAGRRFNFFNNDPNQKCLVMHDVRTEDSGVYYCKLNDTWGPGTELRVARTIDLPQALHRTKMKDGLIILQGLLLAVCIAAVLLRKRQMLKQEDSIYEEPETDHIYEGLAIETCGGGLYEELSVYAQAEGAEEAEAPWE